MALGEYFLQGNGYYGDANKAKNEVILCVGWREKQTTFADDFFDNLGAEKCGLIFFCV